MKTIRLLFCALVCALPWVGTLLAKTSDPIDGSVIFTSISKNATIRPLGNMPVGEVSVVDGGTIDPSSDIICNGSQAPTLTLINYVGSIIRWESSPDGMAPWTTIVNTTDTYSPGALPVTTHFRAVVELVMGTEEFSTESIITVRQPASADAGPVQTVCAGGTITLAGTIGGSATSAMWSAPTGSFSDANALNSTYTPSITNGTVTLTLTTNNPPGPCPPATSTVVITVSQQATANAGTGQTVCAGGTINLAGSIGGSATSAMWSAPSGTFGNPNSLTSTYTPSIAFGTETLTLTTNDPPGLCPPATSTVQITVNQPATVNAGMPQAVCAGGMITLAGMRGGAATSSTWTAPSGTFSNAGSLTSTYTPSIMSGTVTLTLTTNDPPGPCPAVSSTVVITVNANPTVTAGNNVSICGGGNTSLNANASPAGPVYTYTWSNGFVGQGQNVNPPSTTTYTVIATNTTTGCSATNSVTVTVTGPVVSINPPVVEVCSGEPVTLTASANVNSTFTWSNGMTGAIININPTSSQTLTATATATSGMMCQGVKSVVITVNPLPTVNLGADIPICNGTSATLSAQPANGTSPYTYKWSNSTATTQTRMVSPTASTTYTVTVTDSKGCEGTDVQQVIVNQPPVANAGANVSICLGDMASLNASGSTGTPPLTYTWSTGQTGVGISVAPTANTTYTVIVKDGNTPQCSDMEQVTVTIKPQHTALASTTPQGGKYCTGANLQLNGSASGGTTYVYDWSGPQGFSSAVEDPSINGATINMTGTYVLNVTNNGTGCKDTVHLPVTVVADPTVFISGVTPICTGGTNSLSAQIIGGAGTASYVWKENSISQSNTTNTFGTDPLSTSTNYVVVVTFSPPSLGCDMATSPEVTVPVVPQPAPALDGPTNVCTGGQAFYHVTGDPVTKLFSASTFEWNVVGGTITQYFNGDAAVLVLWQPAAGNHRIFVTQRIAGATSCAGTSNIIQVSVDATPASPVTSYGVFKPNNILICKDSAATCYLWGYYDLVTNEISDLDNETYQAFGVGKDIDTSKLTYYVKTWTGDCDAPSNCANITFRSEPLSYDPARVPKFMLYPNPNNGDFNLEAHPLPSADYFLEVFDPLGRLFHSTPITVGVDGMLLHHFETEGLANGLYYAALRSGNTIFLTRSFLVQN